jgi:phospholipid transport system substrate-binding protein
MIQTPWITLVLAGLLWAAAQASPAIATPQGVQDPQQLVEHTTNSVLTRLQSHQEEMRREPHRIYALIEELVLPHFDFERMSRWVLGRYWNSATPEQRSRFMEEFRNLLVRTYGVALLDYTDEKVQFLPSRGDPARGEVMIRTTIEHRGATVAVDYNLFLKDSAWKVYDVTINGVSLVTNYRSSFATEIRKGGIEGLITQLSNRNQGKDEKGG